MTETHADSGGRNELGLEPAAYVRLLALCGLLGVPVALAAVAFQTLVHDTTRLVWEEIPDSVGWESPAGWYVLLVPTLAGVLVAAALRLPGAGGHGPLQGLDAGAVRTVDLVSILPAGLISLAFGLVLGPEAPLIALGLALGVLAVRLVGEATGAQGRLLALAGAFAAVSALFGGNPLLAGLLLMEALAVSGALPASALGPALLPGFVAAGTGALVHTGVGDWSGVHTLELSLPVLPPYDTVRLADLAWCLPLAVAVGLVGIAALRGGHVVATWAGRRPVATLVAAGLLVGALAVVFRLVTDRPVDLVLFSGQQSLAPIVAETSAGVLLVLLVAKGLAYSLSLGAGFRGGFVFPAVTLGVAFGVLADIVLPGLATTPAIVVGIAASGAAVMRLPFSAVLFAVLLTGSGTDTAPIAVLAAAAGWLVAIAVPRGEQARA